MSGRRWQSAVRILIVGLVSLCTWLAARNARAEELVIKRPGDHPVYSVEIEPHIALAAVAARAGSNGIGLGGRFTIPLVQNGFIPTINNSVGVGFGVDWITYNGCYYWNNPYGNCTNLQSIWLPAVMQWNFFLSSHWSVFGEPGFAISYNTWGSDCTGIYTDPRGNSVSYDCGPRPNRFDVNPFVFFAGGRYHFSETVTLTARIGWPYATIGVSFMP